MDSYKIRSTNTLSRAEIIQWVTQVMAELDVSIATSNLYLSLIRWISSECGRYCNPHRHTILCSQYFSALFNDCISDLLYDFCNMFSTRLDTDITAFQNEKPKKNN